MIFLLTVILRVNRQNSDARDNEIMKNMKTGSFLVLSSLPKASRGKGRRKLQ